MIYARDLNLRYYPIAKVACTSIKLALLEASGVPSKPWLNVHKRMHTDRDYIVTNGIVQDLLHISEDSGFGFALVRNPFDRAVSSYVNKVVENHPGLPPQFYNAKSFADFVKTLVEQEPSPKLDGHLRPQHFYLDGKPVELIGRLEEIKDVWKKVCAIAGKDIPLPVTNSSFERKQYRTYYTPELAKKVASYYAVDLDRYGYDF